MNFYSEYQTDKRDFFPDLKKQIKINERIIYIG